MNSVKNFVFSVILQVIGHCKLKEEHSDYRFNISSSKQIFIVLVKVHPQKSPQKKMFEVIFNTWEDNYVLLYECEEKKTQVLLFFLNIGLIIVDYPDGNNLQLSVLGIIIGLYST